MCTAATYQTKNFYMGRTLDYEFSYGDEVTITPRNYPFHFRHAGTLSSHYAMIGMAHVAPDNGVDYPLYYDACNEKSVCMAGLNFVGNAAYADIIDTKENVAQFEFIPWILSQCASVSEARENISADESRWNCFCQPFSGSTASLDDCRQKRKHRCGIHGRRASYL